MNKEFKPKTVFKAWLRDPAHRESASVLHSRMGDVLHKLHAGYLSVPGRPALNFADWMKEHATADKTTEWYDLAKKYLMVQKALRPPSTEQVLQQENKYLRDQIQELQRKGMASLMCGAAFKVVVDEPSKQLDPTKQMHEPITSALTQEDTKALPGPSLAQGLRGSTLGYPGDTVTLHFENRPFAVDYYKQLSNAISDQSERKS